MRLMQPKYFQKWKKGGALCFYPYAVVKKQHRFSSCAFDQHL